MVANCLNEMVLGVRNSQYCVAKKRGHAAPWTKKSRRRSTLPRSHPRSTIDAEELNFRVRDGIGCGLLAVVTGKAEEAVEINGASSYMAFAPKERGGGQAERLISTGLLNELLHAHSRPIDLIVCKVSSYLRWEISS